MGRRDARKKIARGIYEDDFVRYATIHVRGAGFREKRFPLSVPLETIQGWRNDERIRLLGAAKRGTKPGSFARDAHRYVKDFTAHLASAKSRKIEVDTWIAVFGARPRGQITSADVARVRNTWLTSGRKVKPGEPLQPLSPKTINNRVNTLRHLYRCLDGKKAWTPCDDLQPLHVHKTPMQYVPDAVILAVDKKLQQLEKQGTIRSAKPRARFRVTMSTGRRPSEVMRTQPADLDLDRRIWIPRDGKGGFSPGIYLNDDMLAAWQLFIEANAWGHYATDKQAEYLRLAGWPAHIAPYQARHTVGITLSEKGLDLRDVGDVLGHKRIETTRRHYVPVLNSRMQKASEALEGRFAAWVQTAVQTGKSQRGEIRRKSARSAQTKTGRKPAPKRRIPSMKTKKKR